VTGVEPPQGLMERKGDPLHFQGVADRRGMVWWGIHRLRGEVARPTVPGKPSSQLMLPELDESRVLGQWALLRVRANDSGSCCRRRAFVNLGERQSFAGDLGPAVGLPFVSDNRPFKVRLARRRSRRGGQRPYGKRDDSQD